MLWRMSEPSVVCRSRFDHLGLPDCSLPSETGQVTLGPWMLGRGVDIVEELMVVYELIVSECN